MLQKAKEEAIAKIAEPNPKEAIIVQKKTQAEISTVVPVKQTIQVKAVVAKKVAPVVAEIKKRSNYNS